MTDREMIIAMVVKGYGVAWGPSDAMPTTLVVKRGGRYCIATQDSEYFSADVGNAVDRFLYLVAEAATEPR